MKSVVNLKPKLFIQIGNELMKSNPINGDSIFNYNRVVKLGGFFWSSRENDWSQVLFTALRILCLLT